MSLKNLEKRKEFFKTVEGKREILYRMFHRPLYKAMGYTDEELKRPKILIVNSWSECTPGHSYLRNIGDAVKLGVYAAGGISFEFNVPGVCDGMVTDWKDFKYDLLKRDAMAISIDASVKCAGWIDGIVMICGCDKMVPGMLLATARMNVPTIFMTSGTMLVGKVEGKEMMLGDNLPLLKKYIDAEISLQEYQKESKKIEEAIGYCAGCCPEMTTGITMQIIIEALGLALPGTTMIPTVSAEKIRASKSTGMRVINLVKENIKPRDIITKDSIENAISMVMATGGGTNAILHLQALAFEIDINIDLNSWDKISKKCPWICSIAPGGQFSVVDFNQAGSVPATMKNLEDLIHLNCLTVTGKTVKENISQAKVLSSEVIRPINNPLSSQGSIAILKGNLAPRGAVIRHAVISDRSLLKYEWTAKVFDSAEEAMEAIYNDTIEEGEALVVRYEGPKGGPGLTETVGVIMAMNMMELEKVALITDGRFSGLTKKYPAVGHVCPEAFIGGPIAIVKNGDKIKLDVANNKLEIKLSDEKIKNRLKKWTPPKSKIKKSSLALYAKIAEQADNGGTWNLQLK